MIRIEKAFLTLKEKIVLFFPMCWLTHILCMLSQYMALLYDMKTSDNFALLE